MIKLKGFPDSFVISITQFLIPNIFSSYNNGEKMHRLGKKWKEALDKDKDYNLVEDGTGYSEIKTFFPSAISFREYEAIQELKQNLLAKYEGKTLEDVIGGQILETQMGSCFHITSQNRVNFQPITPNITKSNLLSDNSGINSSKKFGLSVFPSLINTLKHY
ncbi:MAG: hypothetical protein ACFFBD_09445 [Candidatus Hodarchaeota archaeon]